MWHRAAGEEKDLTELSVVPLVEEDFSMDLLNHNVPRVDGPSAAHQGGQDGVRGENVDVRCGPGKLADDGVVGGGDGVENSIDPLQRPLILDVDSIVRFIVILHRTATGPAIGRRQS